jgi:hypothetical protein
VPAGCRALPVRLAGTLPAGTRWRSSTGVHEATGGAALVVEAGAHGGLFRATASDSSGARARRGTERNGAKRRRRSGASSSTGRPLPGSTRHPEPCGSSRPRTEATSSNRERLRPYDASRVGS